MRTPLLLTVVLGGRRLRTRSWFTQYIAALHNGHHPHLLNPLMRYSSKKEISQSHAKSVGKSSFVTVAAQDADLSPRGLQQTKTEMPSGRKINMAKSR